VAEGARLEIVYTGNPQLTGIINRLAALLSPPDTCYLWKSITLSCGLSANLVRVNPFVHSDCWGRSTMAMTNKYVSLGTSDLQKGHISLLG